MRWVIDTNVLVSALLKPGSVPDLLLTMIWARDIAVLHDARILREYRDVVARPKLRAIEPARIDAFFVQLEEHGVELEDVPAWDGIMTDEDDRPFVEVALAGHADVLVTGNLRDFPRGLGFAVEPPASVLARLG